MEANANKQEKTEVGNNETVKQDVEFDHTDKERQISAVPSSLSKERVYVFFIFWGGNKEKFK